MCPLFVCRKDGIMTEKQWIQMIADDAVRACKEFGLYLPSVLIAQTCQETGYGETDLSRIGIYNVLGMKKELLNNTWRSDYWHGETYSKLTPEWYGGNKTYITDSFRVYKSYYDCCCDYLEFLRDCKLDNGQYKYRDCLQEKDPYRLIEAVRSRGYCTDPAYSKAVRNIIQKHDLTKFDKEDGTVAYTSINQFLAFFGRSLTDRISANRGSVPAHGANSHKYLAIHYLGVNGDNPDLYNGGYGGHFFISTDGKRMYQAALVTDKIWHVGASSGFRYIHPDARNTNTIGIECGTYTASGRNNDSETWYFTQAAQESLAMLAAAICTVYRIDPDTNLLRHGDITTKNCPSPYKRDEGKGSNWTWKQFKSRVKEYMQQAGAAKVGKDYLEKGDNGDAVRTMQASLKKVGCCPCDAYLPGSRFVDGDFGTTTDKYVRIFQEAAGLKVDGKYGPKTKASLESMANRKNAFDVTVEYFLKMAKDVADKNKAAKYKYGNAVASPGVYPQCKTVSCDRYVGQVLYNCCMYDVGNRAIDTIAKYMLEQGGVKVAVDKIQAGDIAVCSGHVFIVGKKHSDGWERYDSGSQSRIDGEHPTVEGLSGVQYGIRLPFKQAVTNAYRVQAGAFSVRANAEKMLAKVKAAGFGAFLRDDGAGVKDRYVVQAGSYNDRKNAEAQVGRLQAAGIAALIK